MAKKSNVDNEPRPVTDTVVPPDQPTVPTIPKAQTVTEQRLERHPLMSDGPLVPDADDLTNRIISHRIVTVDNGDGEWVAFLAIDGVNIMDAAASTEGAAIARLRQFYAMAMSNLMRGAL